MSKEKTPEEKYVIAGNAGQKIGLIFERLYKLADMITEDELNAMDEYNNSQEAIIPITDPTLARSAYRVNAFERVRDRVELIKRIKSYKEAEI